MIKNDLVTVTLHKIIDATADTNGVYRDNRDRRTALIAAASYCANSDVLSSKDVTDIAERFLTWLGQ